MVSYDAATLYDRYRELQRVFAAARDITERKRFELELARGAAESASRTSAAA